MGTLLLLCTVELAQQQERVTSHHDFRTSGIPSGPGSVLILMAKLPPYTATALVPKTPEHPEPGVSLLPPPPSSLSDLGREHPRMTCLFRPAWQYCWSPLIQASWSQACSLSSRGRVHIKAQLLPATFFAQADRDAEWCFTTLCSADRAWAPDRFRTRCAFFLRVRTVHWRVARLLNQLHCRINKRLKT